MATIIKEVNIPTEKGLYIDSAILEQAGLVDPIQLVISNGEIRILPLATTNPEAILAELAGCLGQESVTEYEFDLP